MNDGINDYENVHDASASEFLNFVDSKGSDIN